MTGTFLQPRIRALIEERKFSALKDMIRKWPPVDLAELISEVSETDILNEMSADDRTALLEELPGAAVNQLIRLPSSQERAIVQSLLHFCSVIETKCNQQPRLK